MILPVLHVGPRDTALAIAALEASARLEGKIDNKLLLVQTNGDASVYNVAIKAFSRVICREYADWTGDKKWPQPQNYAWQTVARMLLNEIEGGYSGWLFWEVDAVPIRKGWFNKLTDAHEFGRKLFSGHCVRDHLPEPYMNGVGIWPMKPIDALQNCSALYTYSTAFDIAARPAVMGSFNDISHLMLHDRKDAGGGPGRTFDTSSFRGLLQDNPEAVFYHGCTDGTLHALVGSIKEPERAKSFPPVKAATPSIGPTIRIPGGTNHYIHCVERHAYPNQPDNERVLVAFNSWIDVYKGGHMQPCHVWSYPRDSRAIGDKRTLPYLKDILVEGMTKAGPNDIIVLTNDDTIFHRDIIAGLDEAFTKADAICSMRLNFAPGKLPSLTEPLDFIVKAGIPDLGRDLIAFRKSWLIEHWNDIPDFFLGELEWDLVLAILIRKSVGIVTTKENIATPTPQCELPRGYVLHLTHDRFWMAPALADAPAKTHNKKLTAEWYRQNAQGMVTK